MLIQCNMSELYFCQSGHSYNFSSWMISTLYANRWTSCMELCMSSYLQFPGHLMSEFNRVSLQNIVDLIWFPLKTWQICLSFPWKHGRFVWVSLENMADLFEFPLKTWQICLGFPWKHGRFVWVSLENMADLLTLSLDTLSSTPAGYIKTFPVTNTCQPGYYRWSVNFVLLAMTLVWNGGGVSGISCVIE